MKNNIKKFENFKVNETLTDHIDKHNSLSAPFNMLEPMDYKRVIRSGRKPYFINDKYEMVEVTMFNRSTLTPSTKDINPNFNFLLFLTDEKKEELTDLIETMGKLEENYRKKMSLLFEFIRAKSEE